MKAIIKSKRNMILNGLKHEGQFKFFDLECVNMEDICEFILETMDLNSGLEFEHELYMNRVIDEVRDLLLDYSIYSDSIDEFDLAAHEDEISELLYPLGVYIGVGSIGTGEFFIASLDVDHDKLSMASASFDRYLLSVIDGDDIIIDNVELVSTDPQEIMLDIESATGIDSKNISTIGWM